MNCVSMSSMSHFHRHIMAALTHISNKQVGHSAVCQTFCQYASLSFPSQGKVKGKTTEKRPKAATKKNKDKCRVWRPSTASLTERSKLAVLKQTNVGLHNVSDLKETTYSRHILKIPAQTLQVLHFFPHIMFLRSAM